MKTSEHVNEIGKAMASVQGEMKPAIKDSNNPFFKSKYSNLTSVWESIREPLKKYEISIFQDVVSTDHGISVVTKMIHSSGQWIEFGPLEIPLGKRDAQSIGSATSYAKRYALSAACGVVTDDEDDDGEKAMNRNGQESMPKNVNKTKAVETPKASSLENCIISGQIETIEKLIKQCDEGYVTKLNKHLLDSGWPTYAHIPQDKYAQIITGINKNIELVKKRSEENV